MMRQSEAGRGNVKLVFTLLFLAVVAFCSIKIVPVYVNNYELNDDIHQLAIQATVDHSSVDAVQNRVIEYAKGLGLPVARENVAVTVGNVVNIDLDYKVPVDLKVYVLVLEFKPSASNKAI